MIPILSSVVHSIPLLFQNKLQKWGERTQATTVCWMVFTVSILLPPEAIVNVKKFAAAFNKTFTLWRSVFFLFFSELLFELLYFFLKWGTCCQPQRPPSTGHVFFPTTSVELIFSLPHFGQISQSCSFAWWRRDGAWELLVKCATTWSRRFDFHPQSGLCF